MLLLITTIAFVSCKKEEIRLSSDVVSKELQNVLRNEQISKVAIWSAPKNNVVSGCREYTQFGIEGGFLRVENEYYNLAQLVTYSVDSYLDLEGTKRNVLRLSFGE